MRNERDASDLLLYHGPTCPYCRKVLDAAAALKIDLPLKDAWANEATMGELKAGGGRYTVPCLRITQPDGSFRWMYESEDIVAYLRSRFGR